MAALVGLAQPASAALWELTYTGQVTDGVDAIGVFGAGGADLTGDTETIQFILDDTKGVFSTGPFGHEQWSGVLDQSPVVAARAVVDGHSFVLSTLGPPFTSYGQLDFFGLNDSVGGTFSRTFGSNTNSITAIGSDTHVLPPFAVFDTAAVGTSTVHIQSFATDNINGSVTEVSMSQLPGVPEPAAWALMILGFGGIGAALRARRTTFA